MAMYMYPITTPQDFNFDECLWFLDRGYNECLFVLRNKRIYRLIELENRIVPACISFQPGGLYARTASSLTSSEQQALVKYITEWFDLDRKLDEFYSLLLGHSALAYMPTAFNGLRLVGIPDLFEALCWSIIGQQINLTFAYKLKHRLVSQYGQKVIWEGTELYHFPTPKVVRNMNDDVLREFQFSRSKINYLKYTAEAFVSGSISKAILIQLPDFLSRQKALTEIKGIGIWSANYALMKSLREPGSIPFGDVGLLQALQNHGLIKERNEKKVIEQLFDRFPNWQAYLVFYFWRSLSYPKQVPSQE